MPALPIHRCNVLPPNRACRRGQSGVTLHNVSDLYSFTDYDQVMAATKTTKGKAPAKCESPTYVPPFQTTDT
jgi:hypothetical protein